MMGWCPNNTYSSCLQHGLHKFTQQHNLFTERPSVYIFRHLQSIFERTIYLLVRRSSVARLLFWPCLLDELRISNHGTSVKKKVIILFHSPSLGSLAQQDSPAPSQSKPCLLLFFDSSTYI